VVSIKRGAILQCETEGYRKRSCSNSNCSFREKEIMLDRGNCERYTGCAVRKNEIITVYDIQTVNTLFCVIRYSY
jgi:hypothetical protein